MVAPAQIDLLNMDARALSALLQDGSLTSVNLVEAHLAQIAKHNEYLRAMICLPPREKLVKVAAALDLERREVQLRSALHGLPIIIKDNIATSPSLGLFTSAGNLALLQSVPAGNARLVDKLIDAGLIIIGKANLSELSNWKGDLMPSGWSAVGGQTQSAYVRGGVDVNDSKDGHSNPSGSSSGSAVGLSAGFAPFAIGTETDGSLVAPAGRAALYTIKPTVGSILTSGIVPISHTFDAAGPITKTPYDLAMLLDVLVDAPQTQQDSYVEALAGSWNDLAIAALDPEVWVWPPETMKPVESATVQIIKETREAYTKIKALAKRFVENATLIGLEAFSLNGKNSKDIVTKVDFVTDFNNYLSDLRSSPVRDLADLIKFNTDHADQKLPPGRGSQDRLISCLEVALNTTKEEYEAHCQHMRHVSRTLGLEKLFTDYNVDILIGLTDSRMMSYAAAAGYPIGTLPLSYLEFNGRPFGLCAITRANREDLLLRLQSAWEGTFGPRKAPPMLSV